MSKVYIGKVGSYDGRALDAYDVFIEEDGAKQILPMCLHIKNHSPTGFCWGYNGSGPAQLALALLCDAIGDVKLAERHYMQFKDAIIARMNIDADFRLPVDEIQEWVTLQLLKEKK